MCNQDGCSIPAETLPEQQSVPHPILVKNARSNLNPTPPPKMTSMLSFIHIFNHHPSPKIKMSHMIREVLKRKNRSVIIPFSLR